MKLTPYRPFPLSRAGFYWHVLGRPRAPRPLPEYLPPSASPSASPQEPTTTPARGGPALFLRHLDCGSCNGCELALHALNTPYYDLPGHGIHFVASPRHANILIMTGPLTYNLKDVALTTLEQLPQPRIIAVGDCAIGGKDDGENGPFRGAYGVMPRAEWPAALLDAIVLEIPGCPPEPGEILTALAQWAQDDK